MSIISMNSLCEPLLNITETITQNEIITIQHDEEINEISDEMFDSHYEINTINYSNRIPGGTIIHYMKENKRYCGRVLDDRKYAPRKEFNQHGYVHTTMIEFENGQKDNLYYQIYQSECIAMESSNCIILNPLIES